MTGIRGAQTVLDKRLAPVQLELAMAVIRGIYLKCHCDKDHVADQEFTSQGYIDLVAHIHRVTLRAETIAEKHDLKNPDSWSLLQASCICHDVGKVFFDDHRNGIMTQDQRDIFTFKHAQKSAEVLHGWIELMPNTPARAADKYFLERVYIVVENHHTPWLIRDREIRRVAYILHWADIRCSMREPRPGHPQPRTLEETHRHLAQRLFWNEYRDDFALCQELVTILREIDRLQEEGLCPLEVREKLRTLAAAG